MSQLLSLALLQRGVLKIGGGEEWYRGGETHKGESNRGPGTRMRADIVDF